MKNFIILLFALSPIVALGQTENQKKILIKSLSSSKIEITKQNIAKTLSDPSHWYLMATYSDNELHPVSMFSSYKFFPNGLFLLAGPLTTKASDVEEGVWQYQNQSKTLKLLKENGDLILKVYILNAVEIIVEDKGNTKYFLSAQTNFYDAPKAMQWKVNYTTLTEPSALKAKWERQ